MPEQGRKYDGGKLRYDLIPVLALEEMVKGLTFGTIKYDDNNWIKVPNGRKRYLAAALRHIQEYRKGNLWDEEQNIHHLSAAMNNLSFIVEKDLRGWEDVEEGDSTVEDISREELKDYTKRLMEQELACDEALCKYIETRDTTVLSDHIRSTSSQRTCEPWYPPVEDGGNPWIEYDGSGQPANDRVLVEIMYRHERENKEWYSCDEPADSWPWEWDKHSSLNDVVAYRVVG